MKLMLGHGLFHQSKKSKITGLCEQLLDLTAKGGNDVDPTKLLQRQSSITTELNVALSRVIPAKILQALEHTVDSFVEEYELTASTQAKAYLAANKKPDGARSSVDDTDELHFMETLAELKLHRVVGSQNSEVADAAKTLLNAKNSTLKSTTGNESKNNAITKAMVVKWLAAEIKEVKGDITGLLNLENFIKKETSFITEKLDQIRLAVEQILSKHLAKDGAAPTAAGSYSAGYQKSLRELKGLGMLTLTLHVFNVIDISKHNYGAVLSSLQKMSTSADQLLNQTIAMLTQVCSYFQSVLDALKSKDPTSQTDPWNVQNILGFHINPGNQAGGAQRNPSDTNNADITAIFPSNANGPSNVMQNMIAKILDANPPSPSLPFIAAQMQAAYKADPNKATDYNFNPQGRYANIFSNSDPSAFFNALANPGTPGSAAAKLHSDAVAILNISGNPTASVNNANLYNGLLMDGASTTTQNYSFTYPAGPNGVPPAATVSYTGPASTTALVLSNIPATLVAASGGALMQLPNGKVILCLAAIPTLLDNISAKLALPNIFTAGAVVSSFSGSLEDIVKELGASLNNQSITATITSGFNPIANRSASTQQTIDQQATNLLSMNSLQELVNAAAEAWLKSSEQ